MVRKNDKGNNYDVDSTHPSDYIRIDFTLRQTDEFYQTYSSVKEGTPMYIAPEDRVLVW